MAPNDILQRTMRASIEANVARAATEIAPNPYRRERSRADWPSIGIVAAVHVAAVYGLMQIDVVRENVAAVVPIMIDLLKPEVPKPPPPPQKVQVKPPPRIEPPPMVTTTGPTTATFEAPPPIVQPAPEPPAPVAVEAPPRPVPAPVLPITPPNFNAAYLDNPPPKYPPMSRKQGEAGQVVLRVRVSADGRAEQIEVKTSSGYERLDRAAAEAVEKWRFVPAKQGEQPIAAWVLVPLTFQLQG